MLLRLLPTDLLAVDPDDGSVDWRSVRVWSCSWQGGGTTRRWRRRLLRQMVDGVVGLHHTQLMDVDDEDRHAEDDQHHGDGTMNVAWPRPTPRQHHSRNAATTHRVSSSSRRITAQYCSLSPALSCLVLGKLPRRSYGCGSLAPS